MTVFTWSTTAADNDDADSTINWRENQAPSTVNNSGRAMMAAVAKLYKDLSGNLVTAGTSTAYTLTTNQVYTSLTDGIFVRCRMSATNGATPTLNVDSLGAKSIASVYGTAIATGALLSGGVYDFVYDSTDDKWICTGIVAPAALGLGSSDTPTFTGINVGNADTTITRSAAGQIAVEGVAVPTISTTDTLTNKTLSLASNTVTGTTAEFNTALSDGNFATLAGAETLTNKTLTSPAINTPTIIGGTVYGALKAETAVTASGQTELAWTSIPTGVKRIVLSVSGLSSSGTSPLIVQLGTGGSYVTTNYVGYTDTFNASPGGTSYTTAAGFRIENTSAAASVRHGHVTLTLVTGTTWACSAFTGNSNANATNIGMASKDIGGAVDRVRVIATNGTDTFDAGVVGLIYE